MSEDRMNLEITSEAQLDAVDRLIGALQKLQEAGGDLAESLSNVEQTADGAEESLQDVEKQGEKGFGDKLAEASQKFHYIQSAANQVMGYAKQAIDQTVGAYVRYADEVGDIAELTGSTTEEVSRLAGAFQAKGLSIDQLNGVLRPFNNGLAEAFTKMQAGEPITAGLGAAMERIGVPITDSSGKLRSLADMFPDIVAGLQTVPPGAERSALSMDIFGRSSMELNDILAESPQKIQELLSRAEELGTVLSEADVKAAEQLKDQMNELNQNIDAVKMNIGKEMVPTLNDAAYSARKLTDGSMDLTTVWYALTNQIDKGREHVAEMQRVQEGLAQATYDASMYADVWTIKQQDTAAATDTATQAIAEQTPVVENLVVNYNDWLDAQERLKAATDDAVLSLYDIGQEIDEALGKAAAEDTELSVNQFERLAEDLKETTARAREAGVALPKEDLAAATEKANLLRDALARMDVPESVRAALKRYLEEIYGNLVAIGEAANSAGSGITGIGHGAGAPTPAGNAPVALQHGGIVTRPTLAILGEGYRPEAVVPLTEQGGNRAKVGGTTINANFQGRIGRREEKRFIRRLAREINWSR